MPGSGFKTTLYSGVPSVIRFALASAFVFTSSAAVTAATPRIENLRAGKHADYVRLVLDLSDRALPDIVRHGDGFAMYFDGVTVGDRTLVASAGTLNARIETSNARTAVYVDGVMGNGPLRKFTLPGADGNGFRFVLDFTPAVYTDGLTPPAPQDITSIAVPTLATPRVGQTRWSVSNAPVQSGSPAPTKLASARMDIMAGAPTQPMAPPPPRSPEPPKAILSDTKVRDRRNPWDFYGYIEAEARPYFQPSEDGDRDRVTGSVAIEPTVEVALGDKHNVTVTGFARYDAVDDKRTHIDVREAKYEGVFDNIELTLGFDQVFWGTTESFHLVDIINQIDGVEDIDDEDKLGELMAAVSYISPVGTFSAFALPLHRQRRFPGPDGRPNGALVVDTDQVAFQSPKDEWRFSYALRYQGTFDAVDLGLSYFSGVARDPRLTLGLADAGQPILVPNYDLIDQVGVDAQVTLGPMLLKAEGIYQWNDFEDFSSFIAGFEYTFFNAFGSADIGLLSEFLYDDRGEAAPVPFEEDVFVGARLSFNNTADTSLLAGAIIDLDGDGVFVNVEGQHRIGEKWRLSVEARILSNTASQSAFSVFQDDDYVQIRLARFF